MKASVVKSSPGNGALATLYRVRFDSFTGEVELQTAPARRARSRYRLVDPREELLLVDEQDREVGSPALVDGPQPLVRVAKGHHTLILVASPSKHRVGFTRAELAKLGVRLTAEDAAADAVERVGRAIAHERERIASLEGALAALKALRRGQGEALAAVARTQGMRVLRGKDGAR
jgi:hypothetical protein